MDSCGGAELCLFAPPKETTMLKTVVAILVVLWLLGFILHIAGSLIHLLLGIAVAVLLVDLITGRRHAL